MSDISTPPIVCFGWSEGNRRYGVRPRPSPWTPAAAPRAQ
jgi:hypothetical protein